MDGGLKILIVWLPPKDNIVPVHHYLIEYRTVGQWVPLTDVDDIPTERFFYKWERPSRGATYQFRVLGCSESGACSEPSPVHTITTRGLRYFTYFRRPICFTTVSEAL